MKKILILLFFAGLLTFINEKNEYVEIPSSSIRMRVIASSNSEQDQADKKQVKSIIEEKIYELIKDVRDEKKVEEIINDKKSEMDEELKMEMEKRNIDVDFTSNFGYNYFPEKEFKGLTYKAGNYKSYVVTLGEGSGENWWCVLYPPLCLIDENKSDYEYHSLIKDTILKYN